MRSRPARAHAGGYRIGGLALVAVSIAVPLLRRRLRIPSPATVAAAIAAPLGVGMAMRGGTRGKVACFHAAQMWTFFVIHELPYDDPDRCRERVRVDYPIRIDRLIGLGTQPNIRLQKLLSRGEPRLLDKCLTWAHWMWFFEPHVTCVYILWRRPERAWRAVAMTGVTYQVGAIVYWALPTAPPWWASEIGRMPGVTRIIVPVGKKIWGKAWDPMFGVLGGNPLAAMPSLHFGSSVMAARLLAETGPVAGAAGWTYAVVLGFALVYLGEHYVIDLIAGYGLVEGVRRSVGRIPIPAPEPGAGRGFPALGLGSAACRRPV